MDTLHFNPWPSAENGVAERTVRRVLEGARTILLVSGLNEPWWPLAVRHWSFAYNIDQGAVGDSPYNRRHWKGHYTKLRAPFGSLIDFEPVPAKQKEELKMIENSVFLFHIGAFSLPASQPPVGRPADRLKAG